MGPQSNLDYQTFWAPRPLSRPRCAENQSHSRPRVSQPKSSPLPLNDNRSMACMLKESLDSSPRLASDRDDFIYISDDAASDLYDASPEPSDETLPSIQAIVRSLEETEKTGSTVEDCDQTSQRKDEHEATGRWASSPTPEHAQINESRGPSVDLAAGCTIGVSASSSRIRTSAPTAMTAGSRPSSPSGKFSLWDAASPQTRCTSIPADDEGVKKTSTSEMPRRVDSQLRFPSSTSQPQLIPSPSDHDCARVDMTPKELPDPSPRLALSKDDFIYVSDDTASDKADASGGKPSDEALPSVQAAVQSLEETGEIGSTIRDYKQTSNSKDEREPPYTSTSSTPLDQRQLNHSAGFSFAEPADCPTDVPPTISRIRALTPSRPASSPPNSRSPEPQLWDTVSTHTSCTSMSAAGKDAEETDDQNCTETNSPEKSNYNSSALEYTCDEEPLMSQMHPRAQSKRLRESLANHVAEQPGAEGLRGALDDPEYCPSTSDELEDYSDSSSGDEEQPSGKRRKFRTESRRNNSRSQQSVDSESAGLDQASELISATQKDAHAVAEPTDAVFDEWILQDVVLKRTIMAGKATFLFQFDWDLCMNHGSEAGQVLKRSNQQSRGRSTVSGTKRRDRKLRDETKGRRCGVCGKPGHNARTCQ